MFFSIFCHSFYQNPEQKIFFFGEALILINFLFLSLYFPIFCYLNCSNNNCKIIELICSSELRNTGFSYKEFLDMKFVMLNL